ncbi:hypothetical protein [Microbulbifer variabilis]|uniref:hypothetical protein n=1 Tax=Microbulbifer variabilis TaxID=266805 RepID=UPI00036574B9|nr:hypothetical protein [Microbulbifer variabilis]
MSKSIVILGAVTVFLVLAFSVVNIQQGGRNLDQILMEVSASAEMDAQKEMELGQFDFLAEAYGFGFGDGGRRVPGIGFEKYNKCLKQVASLRIYLRSGDVTWEKTELENLKELTEVPKSTHTYAASFNLRKFKWLTESGVIQCT